LVEELNLSEMLGFEARWYEEGKARFIAPVFPTTEQGEPVAPRKAPVFFNPFSALSRDLTVLLVRAFDRRVKTAEPLAGSGVRSIRLLLETSNVEHAYLNDINPKAVKVIRLNSQLNGVTDKVEVSEGDAAVFLASHITPDERFYYVDVDPVGPPVKFVEDSLRACETGGYLGVSATDLASLVGKHPRTCLRKYGLISVRSFFAKESALRLLSSFVILRGMSLNIAAEPVLSIYHRHFIRVFFRTVRSTSRCNFLQQKLGWIQACSNLHMAVQEMSSPPSKTCLTCGGKASIIGPAWLGPLHSRELVEKMLVHSDEYPTARKTLTKAVEEVDVVGFYPVDQIARMGKTKPPSPTQLIERLRQHGYKASTTHIDPTGVKTDAPIDEILRLLA